MCVKFEFNDNLLITYYIRKTNDDSELRQSAYTNTYILQYIYMSTKVINLIIISDTVGY